MPALDAINALYDAMYELLKIINPHTIKAPKIGLEIGTTLPIEIPND